ncbi:glycosyltransferase family 2 protein [Lutibacter sp.]|uniref:glycosyltransferase family 2 protein n=1 Tax=Lutibacter sp. TaxID=1925666 RepID=UPI0027370D7E|nr:glycosyltransferase family 2 protein [Lutibacter sp.]MDP3312585.1 glycosyltransferase family 2 protein [Lutibacter sp.]
MNQNALISIIIPNYNREHLIAETLDSVMAQTYTNWECIIVDDHSTDNSWKIVAKFCEKDGRFIQVKRPDTISKGACSCRNYGFQLSKGAYINWFDSDDIMVANKLEKQILGAEKNNSDLVVCQTQFFEHNVLNLKHYWNKTFTPKYDPLTDFITFRLAWSTNAPLWKKSFLESKYLFNTSLTSSQDLEFHVRLLTYLPKFVVINKILVFNRVHAKRIGVLTNNNRQETRLNSRVLVFNSLKEKDLLNKEIKNYFISFFINQLKYINNEEISFYKSLILKIKFCTGNYKWYLNFYPRIMLYLFIFKIFEKRHLTFKYLIKQVINEGRI